jgi:hypothetical protein
VSTAIAHPIDRLPAGTLKRISIGIVFFFALGFCCLPVVVFGREAGGGPAARIGAIDLLTGDALAALLPPDELRHADPEQTWPALWINHLLPPDASVLCVGEATPFYYRDGRITYQTTWDRGPMSRLMRQAPDDPGAWIDALAAEGFTHLLVNVTMLRIWEDEEWNDPLITVERVVSAAEQSATIEQRFPSGIMLYRLPAPVRR